MKKKITYNNVYIRMQLLAEILSLKLPKKALSETLILRAYYGKAVDEFEQSKKQMCSDATSGKDPEKDKGEIEKIVSEAILSKSEEDAGVADRKFSSQAFEEVVGAAMEAGTMKSAMFIGEDKKPVSVDALLWLQPVAYNLAE